MKIRKKLITSAMIVAMMMGTATTALAGQWQQNSKGWWWQEDNGTYPKSQWQWIDGNKDGIAECYYFDNSGYMLSNTTTPDGYVVNGDGAMDGRRSSKDEECKHRTRNDKYVKRHGCKFTGSGN